MADPQHRSRLERTKPPQRQRVVLAAGSGSRAMAKTIVELSEQTSVGEHLVRSLVKAQLRTALALGLLVLLTIGSLPALLYLLPQFGDLIVLGVRVPWVVLGALPYPLLYGVGVWYVRRVERNERDFVNMVDR